MEGESKDGGKKKQKHLKGTVWGKDVKYHRKSRDRSKGTFAAKRGEC